MQSQWKSTSRFTHVLSMIAAVIISGSVLGAVMVGITGTDEVAAAGTVPVQA